MAIHHSKPVSGCTHPTLLYPLTIDPKANDLELWHFAFRHLAEARQVIAQLVAAEVQNPNLESNLNPSFRNTALQGLAGTLETVDAVLFAVYERAHND